MLYIDCMSLEKKSEAMWDSEARQGREDPWAIVWLVGRSAAALLFSWFSNCIVTQTADLSRTVCV